MALGAEGRREMKKIILGLCIVFFWFGGVIWTDYFVFALWKRDAGFHHMCCSEVRIAENYSLIVVGYDFRAGRFVLLERI